VSCEQILHDRSLVTGQVVLNLHADLTAVPKAVGQARALVASALSGGPGRMLDPDLVYTAQLVASELVTNAVLHARTDLHLGLCHDDHTLLIAVADGAAPDGPGIVAADARIDVDSGESGRGMVIVATLADDFGWQPRLDRRGKVMWALIALENGAAS
jgi:anti-sigma regulatory factor (Ser/Thr protein kinase)